MLVLPSADGGKSVPVNGLAHAPFKFSVARESTGAVALGSSAGGVGIMFAGGWISWKEPVKPRCYRVIAWHSYNSSRVY